MIKRNKKKKRKGEKRIAKEVNNQTMEKERENKKR